MNQLFCVRSRTPLLCIAIFLSFLAAGTPLRAASIDPSRLPATPWAGNVGLPGGIPSNYSMYCNVRVSIPGTNLLAVADGITDDAPAINYAVQHCPNGEYVYLPAGNYRTNSTITRQGVNEYDHVQRPFSIELKGDGPALTKILFYGSSGDAMYFTAAGGENAQTMAIASGDSRGSTQLTLTSVSPYMAVGLYAIVHRLNAEATTGTDPSYMIDTASQMVKVTSLNTATNTITFTPALNEAYPSDYLTIGISAPFRTGVQDLYIENMTNNNGHNINFNLGQECWVKNVESNDTAHWHIRLQTCARSEVRECVIHDGWSAGGDHDYGVGLFQYSCNNLVENNVFFHCRHAMEMEYGGQDNVFGYNYSYDPVNSDIGAGLGAELATDYLMGDELNHGGDIRWNLREGNVAAAIRFDCVLGASSYNTVFRNQIQRRGLAPVIVANFGSDIQKWSYYSNLSGNVYEAAPTGFAGSLRRWGTNQDAESTTWTVTGASNTNPVVLTVSGTPFGTGDIVTVSGVLGDTAANVASVAITYIDSTHFSLDGVDGTASGAYAGGGTVVSGPDAKAEATTLLDGEYDVKSGTITWAGSDHSLPESYYLAAKPAWFGTLAWPAVDPTNPVAVGTALIPAGYRQANGAPPAMAPYIEADPQAATEAAGTAAIFTADFEAYPAASVQWQVSSNGGSSWNNITSGSAPYTVTTVGPPNSTSATDTRSTLTIDTNAVDLTGNLYQCIATNGEGTAVSSDAGLTVTGTPAGISGSSSSGSGSSSSSGSGSSSSSGSGSSSSSGSGTSSSSGSGSSSSSGTGSSSSSGSGSSSSGTSGTANVAPAFTLQPQSQTVTYGSVSSVVLTAAASGTPAPTYQWMLGGVALSDGGRISGSRTPSLTIAGPLVSDSGSYSVVASNGVAPTATSTAATLTVNKAAQTIAFTLPASAPTGSAAPALTATASSGLAVIYTSSNPAVATVSGSTLTLVGAGSTTITAIQWGNGNIQSAPAVARTLTVTSPTSALKPAPAITSAAAASGTVGSPFSYTIIASNSSGSFSASGLPGGLSVGPYNGVISGTPTAAGTYAVTLQAKNSSGSGIATLTLTIKAGTVSGNFAGSYFGSFGSGGTWALDVGANNSGLFVSKVGSVAVTEHVTVAANGTFTVAGASSTAAIVTRTAASDSLPYIITLKNGGATGTAGPDSVTGTLDAAASASAYAGGYVTSALNGSSGNVYVVVGPDGRLFALELNGTTADTVSGFLSASGTLNTVTSGGGAMTLTTSASGQMLVTYTAAGTSSTVEFLGLSGTTSSTSRIINLSARGAVGSGANIMIAGAVVSGAQIPVLFRAVGPTLSAFGVANALPDPELNVFQGDNVVASNTGWGGSPALAADFSTVGAFALPDTSADDAILTTLNPAPYTIQISGGNSTSGVALAEIYTADTAPEVGGRLVDISARAQVSTGANLIAGFVISGNGPETVLLRAIGPGLTQFGVTNNLASPVLTLMDSAGNPIAVNQGWGGATTLASASTAVGAFAVDPASKDSELLVTLAPGSYTALVASADTGNGTALVEVYEVQ